MEIKGTGKNLKEGAGEDMHDVHHQEMDCKLCYLLGIASSKSPDGHVSGNCRVEDNWGGKTVENIHVFPRRNQRMSKIEGEQTKQT